ncbi:MAG: iron transporter [Streptosporangiaceae bacterium]|nr:iron transporter [Streptosporangiaceae bacterium]
MLGTYLIGLREGLEASLVVGLVCGYLLRTGQRRQLLPIWFGVVAALLLSAAFATALSLADAFLSLTAQEAFGAAMSLTTVGLVVAMVCWAKAHGGEEELEERLQRAVRLGPLTLAAVPFVMIGREGAETTLLLWTDIKNAGFAAAPILGAAAGLASAVAGGYLVYRRERRADLRRFFRWTGAALVIVAAGILGDGISELQSLGVLPGAHAVALSTADLFAGLGTAGTLIGSALSGLLSLTPEVTWLQLTSAVLFATVGLYMFLRQGRTTPVERLSPEAVPAVAEEEPSIGVDTRVRRRPDLRWDVLLTRDVLRLGFAGKTIEMPARVTDEVRYVLGSAGEGFTPGAIPGDLDEPGRLVLIQTLVHEGFLTPVPARADI